jgi:hypothetical protein
MNLAKIDEIMAEQYMRHDYASMYDIWKTIIRGEIIRHNTGIAEMEAEGARLRKQKICLDEGEECAAVALRDEVERLHELLRDTYLAAISTTVVHRGDAIKWRSLCDRMLEVLEVDQMDDAAGRGEE